jgi:hypothetical protein
MIRGVAAQRRGTPDRQEYAWIAFQRTCLKLRAHGPKRLSITPGCLQQEVEQWEQ